MMNMIMSTIAFIHNYLESNQFFLLKLNNGYKYITLITYAIVDIACFPLA